MTAAEKPSPAPVAPLLLWLSIQLLVLLAGASRFPLWAKFPSAGEKLALHEMLAAQIIFSSLLFPWLLRDLKTAAMISLTALPFIQFTGFLAAADLLRSAHAAVYVSTWIFSLAILKAAFHSTRTHLIASAIVNAYVLGGPLLLYLHNEFSDSTNPAHIPVTVFGPVPVCLTLLSDFPQLDGWLWPALVIATSTFSHYAFGRKSRDFSAA